MKHKHKHLIKKFNATKPKYTILFLTTTLSINFLQRKRMNFTIEIIGEKNVENVANHCCWDIDLYL